MFIPNMQINLEIWMQLQNCPLKKKPDEEVDWNAEISTSTLVNAQDAR